MGHLIEKKYQVTGHYLCTKYIFCGVQNCISGKCALYFILCGSISFIHVTNELYLHYLSADIKYVDLCATL